MAFCKYCGSQLADGATNCMTCGATVNQEPVQQPVEQATYQPSYQQPTYQQPTYQQPAEQPAYQQPTYQQQQPAYQPTPEVPGKGLAITSLVLGILSFFCCAFISGVAAIICGAVAKNKGYPGGAATGGIVCGIIGIVLWIIGIIVGVIAAANA